MYFEAHIVVRKASKPIEIHRLQQKTLCQRNCNSSQTMAPTFPTNMGQDGR